MTTLVIKRYWRHSYEPHRIHYMLMVDGRERRLYTDNGSGLYAELETLLDAKELVS